MLFSADFSSRLNHESAVRTDDLAQTLITQMTEFYSTAISIFPSTTLTGYDGTPSPPVVTCPVVTSYLKPCARQVTILPFNLPEPSDAPAWTHVSPMA